MWYSEVQFISGIKDTIVFLSEEEASNTYNEVISSKERFYSFHNNGTEVTVNLNNVEKIKKPEKYKKEE